MTCVGQYIEKFNALTGSSLPCSPIYQSDGLAVHIQNHHPNCVSYISQIAAIIAAPDYVGHNPNEPDSIELVKVFDQNIQIAIKLDKKAGRLYVASLYDVPQSKITRRLVSGRLKKFI